jgi:hypothetical protein
MTKHDTVKRDTERLRAALRENLKRRKLQAQMRTKLRSEAPSKAPSKSASEGPSAAERSSPDALSTPAHESAEIGADKRNR